MAEMDAIRRGIQYAVQRGGTVVIVTDNRGCYLAWKKKWSSNSDFACLMNECEVIAKGLTALKIEWIPGVENPADDPSRGRSVKRLTCQLAVSKHQFLKA